MHVVVQVPVLVLAGHYQSFPQCGHNLSMGSTAAPMALAKCSTVSVGRVIGMGQHRWCGAESSVWGRVVGVGQSWPLRHWQSTRQSVQLSGQSRWYWAESAAWGRVAGMGESRKYKQKKVRKEIHTYVGMMTTHHPLAPTPLVFVISRNPSMIRTMRSSPHPSKEGRGTRLGRLREGARECGSRVKACVITGSAQCEQFPSPWHQGNTSKFRSKERKV